jgi:tight adherence protein B
MGGLEVSLNRIVGAAAFVFVMAIWAMGVLAWYRRRAATIHQMETRLDGGLARAAGTRVLRLWKEGKQTTTTVPVHLRRSMFQRFEQLRRDAGVTVPVAGLSMGVLGTAAAVFVTVVLMTNSIVAAGILAAAIPFAMVSFLKWRAARRLALFENQFVDALDLAARSLRAGHPLVGAFRLIAQEMSPPVSIAFNDICQLQSMGVGLEQAVRDAAAQSNSNDMKLFSTSVAIQLRSGGSLADMMNRLAVVIRDRIRLQRRLRVATSQTDLSKRVLIVMPFVLFALLNALNPGYMEPLYRTQLGRSLLAFAAAGLVVGIWVMRRLSKLKY